MCDELIETIKFHPKFKMIRDTRKNYAEKPLHPDTELHILAFDVIFCSTVYNLFEGIHYSVRNAEEKRIHLEKMNEAKKRESKSCGGIGSDGEAGLCGGLFCGKTLCR